MVKSVEIPNHPIIFECQFKFAFQICYCVSKIVEQIQLNKNDSLPSIIYTVSSIMIFNQFSINKMSDNDKISISHPEEVNQNICQIMRGSIFKKLSRNTKNNKMS